MKNSKQKKWKEYKLGDIFEYQKKSKRKAGDGKEVGKYCFYTSSQNKIKCFDIADYKKESIVLGTGGSPSVHYAINFSTSADTFVMCPSRKDVCCKYVYYFLKGKRNILQKGFKGAGLKHLSKDYTNKILINFPLNKSGELDLAEQKRIVAILEEAEQLKNKREMANQKMEELIPAFFVEVFGKSFVDNKWPKYKLEDLCDIRRGASPRPIDKFLGGSVPWIKIGDGTKNGDDVYISDTKEKIIQEGVNGSVLLKPGSLIFANCGVSLGFARILKIEGCIHDGWLALENVSDKIDKIYLLKLINRITNYLRQIAPDGTQPNLNTGIMKRLEIPVPPIKLQKEFSKKVKLVTQVKEKNICLTDKINTMFESVIHKAFSGEL